MADPTSEELTQLLTLADTDGRVRRLRRQLDDLAEQKALDAAQATLITHQEAHGDLTLERDRVQAEATREDREVDLLRERLAAEQQRLYGGEITNAKELASMKAEIDSVEERIDKHETAELEALEKVEAFESEMAALTELADQVTVQIGELTAARDAAAQALLADIAELEVQSAAQRTPIPEDLLVHYDRSAEKHGALAVAQLDGDRCTACGISLSYADVNDLMEGPSLTSCPSCNRLMVVL